MKNVKLTKEDYHQGVHTVQFVDDVIKSTVKDVFDKPEYTVNAINIADPIHSFIGDKGEVLVNTGEEFELKMTDFFYQKVAAYKKDDVVAIECKYNDKWEYTIARTNTVNVPNTQTYSNGAATIPDAASRIDIARKEKKIVAEGQVRMHFSLGAFKMGLDIKDETTQDRIEDYVKYVMKEKPSNTVEPPSPNDPDSRPKPPPHTDAEVPQTTTESDPF